MERSEGQFTFSVRELAPQTPPLIRTDYIHIEAPHCKSLVTAIQVLKDTVYILEAERYGELAVTITDVEKKPLAGAQIWMASDPNASNA